MRKLGDLVSAVDRSVDRKLAPLWRFVQKYFIFFSSTVLILLLTIFLFRVFLSRSTRVAEVIQKDLTSIEKVLNKIDKKCNILSIRSERAFVDFLTVEKFTGSVVGCLNLAYAGRWKGPYLERNPTLQGRFYEIVLSKEGYFVVPGYGAKLPDGSVMGKDVVITSKTSVLPMLKAGGKLTYKKKKLGLQLPFKVGDWDSPRIGSETIRTINEMLEEFNEALPFTYNKSDNASFCVSS